MRVESPGSELRGDWERARTATRSEMAADRIASVARGVEPGARLGTKEELRVLCGVSVGTLNEALRLLQARGLVTVRPGPGGGLFAAEQSPMVRLGNSVLALDSDATSVADAARIRDALEPLLVEDALWHASPADIADLRAKVAGLADAAKDLDVTAFLHANWALHSRMAAVSPNTMLRSLYTNLLDLIESHTLGALPDTHQAVPDYLADRLRIHRDLVEAIASGDSAAARSLIAEHHPHPSRT